MEAADPRPRDPGDGALPPPGGPSPTSVVSLAETLAPPGPGALTVVADLDADPYAPPMFQVPPTSASPGHRPAPPAAPERIVMWPFRLVAIAGVALGFVLYGWQVFRAIDEQERLRALEWAPFLAGAAGAFGVVLWTYVVVENARRVYAPATVSEPPEPGRAASSWIVPMIFATLAAVIVSVLTQRVESPIEGTENSLPLVLGIAAILVGFPLLYWPVNYLSGVVRKVGGKGVRLGEWLLVPVVLAVVGAAMIYGLRAGITFGDETDGFAPTWVVGVAAIVPATVVVLLGWRAAVGVENDIVKAFDRRAGTNSSFTGRRGKFASMFADDGPNHMALRNIGHIRQIPGGNVVGMVITAALAGLTLLSVVGAVVMYLFWQESNDGLLLPNQIDRAWNVLASLQSAERTVAFVALGIATVWTAMTVINVRMASARRRNPLISALAWPAAGAGIWMIGDRFVSDGSAHQVVAGFAAQAVLLYVPFVILERSADAVGARRNPIRFAAAIGVVLLVQIQGLGGLSTLAPSSDASELGPLVGYLALGALVQLLAMFAVTDATRSLGEMTAHVADVHNELVAQRGGAAPPGAVPYNFVPDRA
ncbi:MAG: hypothetical protein HKN44_13315 [Ilumatobacter sp.]|nr:hypothetical protein [Ilumatobacter sp.]